MLKAAAAKLRRIPIRAYFMVGNGIGRYTH